MCRNGPGYFGRQFGKLLLDEGERAGLAGGEHRAVRRLGQGWYCSHVSTLCRCPKASCSGTMVTWYWACVGDQRGGVGRADGTAGRRESGLEA